jgi:hypothetical protein
MTEAVLQVMVAVIAADLKRHRPLARTGQACHQAIREGMDQALLLAELDARVRSTKPP